MKLGKANERYHQLSRQTLVRESSNVNPSNQMYIKCSNKQGGKLVYSVLIYELQIKLSPLPFWFINPLSILFVDDVWFSLPPFLVSKNSSPWKNSSKCLDLEEKGLKGLISSKSQLEQNKLQTFNRS